MFTVAHIREDDSLDPILDGGGEEIAYRHASTMREWIAQEHRWDKRDILLLRNGTPTRVHHPDGTTSPPPGSEAHPRYKCRRDTGTCFCVPCRAARGHE